MMAGRPCLISQFCSAVVLLFIHPVTDVYTAFINLKDLIRLEGFSLFWMNILCSTIKNRNPSFGEEPFVPSAQFWGWTSPV